MNAAPAPPQMKPPGHGNNTDGRRHGEQNKRYLIPGLALLLLALTLAVLFVLPAKVKQQAQPQSVAKNGTESGADNGAESRIDNSSALPVPPASVSGVAQHDAGLALQAFLRLRAQGDLQNAEAWAPGIWLTANTSAESGDDHYGHRRFKEAQTAYETARDQLKQLQTDRSRILAETLTSGNNSLESGQADAAASAFERALAMQADHQAAQAGLAKAQVRAQVLELMKDGLQAEDNKQTARAAEAYTAALQLDSTYEPAQFAQQAVNETLAQEAYLDAVSQALNHLNSGNLTAAEKAIDTAATIKADTPEIQDARERLASAKQKSRLNTLRNQARAQAAKESWSKAIGLYEAALSIDGQASFARSGLPHAKSRLDLNTQLDHYLDAPERLSSEAPLKNAQTLLQVNPGVALNEPLLAAKLSALRGAVKLATTPVTLLIESDKQTEVTIYHVGRLGTFEQKQLSLRPGRYTVTGTRTGYRDVRKVITLSPASPTSLSIRCEEPI